MTPDQLFDRHAASYDEDLSRALSPSGESREFFARGRTAWLARCLREISYQPRLVLDYGCGDGATSALLLAALCAEQVTGVDVSEKSIDIARARFGTERITFTTVAEFTPSERMGLAYLNGVLHHVPPLDRLGVVSWIGRSLGPGGILAAWENNPWSPAARYVMSRCAFDKDAIMLWPSETRKLLRLAGFQVVRTDFLFILPRAFRALRGVEDFAFRVPLGAQYQVLARKIP